MKHEHNHKLGGKTVTLPMMKQIYSYLYKRE